MKTLQHFQNGTPPKKGAKVSEVLMMNMGDAKKVRVSTATAVPGDFQHCLTIGRHAPPPTNWLLCGRSEPVLSFVSLWLFPIRLWRQPTIKKELSICQSLTTHCLWHGVLL